MMSRTARWTLVLVILLIVIVAGIVALVYEQEIPPAEVDAAQFPQEQIRRGQNVAAAGMCVVCHTAAGGAANAGGHRMETPFGIIVSTNITPDADTGIGAWSFDAFERAMRRGIARDGSHLYPAFPYTAFTKMSEQDMRDLYAYLMSRPPVRNEPDPTRLPFPFNIRMLMAGWNLLFLDRDPVAPVASESEAWNRGKYLAQALGHCSACHSPRNALGAEKGGRHYLDGGSAEGWIAPALNASSRAAVPWTEDDLFAYLRKGYSAHHGAAGASMTPVVREGTSRIPEDDTRALAAYFAGQMGVPADATPELRIRQREAAAEVAVNTLDSTGARIYNRACAACHHPGPGAPEMFGGQPPIWLATSLRLDQPDNVVRYVLNGTQHDAGNPREGHMPGFAYALNDEQVAAVVQFMRESFTDRPAWNGVQDTVKRIRDEYPLASQGREQ
ncbi:Nicotinate dehydrogenase subunit B [Pigmentiphaga humi]|uniref:Nicotinate dehydrogenase subunit B n=1 Tax=Pigmentiphaga humi TaxID=2478468 RepID=A0A3P4AXC4_9BURK|nr:cytochrome c [Pigmentiphaga humi]VCU68422.1 Nicotinate dehydrogenase subunit B [Pigmentiphaga humi]